MSAPFNPIADAIASNLTEADAALLGDLGHDERTRALLAAEHAARTQAIIRTCEPSFAKNLFLILSRTFLNDANAIHAG